MGTPLIVGGSVIKVAPGGVTRDRLDAVDRARAFDQTYRASLSGLPKREFHFTTPPIARATADVYEAILSIVTPQVCSGDIIGGGANQALWSEDFTNAAWVKSNMTAVLTGNPDPMGGAATDTLTATGANGTATQSLAAGASIVRTGSVWLKRVSGSGVVNIITPDSATYVPCALTTGWQRFSATGVASTARVCQILIATNGDAVHAFGYQLEDGPLTTAYQKTTTVAVSNLTLSCCSEITDWKPVMTAQGHSVVIGFTLHEA